VLCHARQFALQYRVHLMLCPKCNTDHAHRSHRKGVFERLAGVLRYYPYRCRECQHRFLASWYAAPSPAGGRLAVEREIRATRRKKKWQQRKRELLVVALASMFVLFFLYYLTRPAFPFGG
jgi:hypothetical protein